MRTHALWMMGLLLLGIGFAAFGAPTTIAMFTDLHVHDTNSPEEEKVMVNWESRLSAFVEMANTAGVEAVVQLGDFINGKFVMGAELGDPERIPAILDASVVVLNGLEMPIHHVLGNHDVYDLSKEQFLAGTGQEAAYYSFDLNGFHFVILDAQYNRQGLDYAHAGWMVQGTVPEEELEWLRQDLAASELPTVILIHQPLDVNFAMLAGGPPVSNHLAVRAVLVEDPDVIAVFQGHAHDPSHQEIDGIHYITLAGFVDHDPPAPLTWALVTFDADAGTITIDGEGLQEDLELAF